MRNGRDLQRKRPLDERPSEVQRHTWREWGAATNARIRSIHSVHHELDALLDRIVAALERRDRSVMAGRGGCLPRFGDAHGFTGAELLVLHALREHAAGGPAPDF